MNIILTDNHDITIVKSVRSGWSSCKVPKLPLQVVILLGYGLSGPEFKSNFWLLENILTIGSTLGLFSSSSISKHTAQLEAVYIDDHFILSGIRWNKYLPKAAIWLPSLIPHTLTHSLKLWLIYEDFFSLPRTKRSNKHIGNTLDVVVYPKQREPIFIYLCNCVMSVAGICIRALVWM